MKRVCKILCRLALLLSVLGLGGCGYASSPGIVVETKQYPLSDKTTLIVTRHLDYWKTGSLFKFEWYVVKCRRKTGPEVLFLESMVVRGTFSNEIPNERIQISDEKIGYAYFNNIVVFDKDCNEISYFNPWRNHAIHPETMRSDYRIHSANIEPTGRGYIRLLWAAKKAGEYEGYPPSYKEPLNRGIEFKTNDFGVHWTLPNSDMDVRE